MQIPGPSTLTLLAILPLLAWRLYSRVRRLVGRQRLSRIRPWITLTIFPLLVLGLAYVARSNVQNLSLLACGVVLGALLGRFGLSKTQFEPTKEGLFYTPHAHLGIALSLLFAARIAYRLVEVYLLHPDMLRNAAEFGGSPLTLSVFGLLAGYYITYAIGLVRWRYRVLHREKA